MVTLNCDERVCYCFSVCDEILAVPGNELCADCGARNPQWASINIGVTLCIACCGVHRAVRDAWIRAKYVERKFAKCKTDENTSSGPSSSKRYENGTVPSSAVELEHELADYLRLVSAVEDDSNTSKYSGVVLREKDSRRSKRMNSDMAEVSTSASHSSRMGVISSDRQHATVSMRRSSSIPNMFGHSIAEGFVQEVMDELNIPATVAPHGSDSNLAHVEQETKNAEDVHAEDRLLYEGALHTDFMKMCEALARGACVNRAIPSADGRTPLFAAVSSDSVESVEYLLLNGAKVNVQDLLGQTPLHVASEKGLTGHICQLLRRGANQDVKNGNGQTALDIAIDATNADVVTLLRLAKMRQVSREGEDWAQMDDATFADVFRDFLSSRKREKSESSSSNRPVSSLQPPEDNISFGTTSSSVHI